MTAARRPVDAPEGVVFDCDGLLLDTESCWTRGEQALFARYGLVFTPEHKRRLLGTAGAVTAGILEELLDRPGQGRQLAAEMVALAWDEVARGARPQPGAARLVAALRGRVPIAVASNSPHGLVDVALEASGLSGVFDVVIGVDDVEHPKPAPDIYEAACRHLAVSPERSVALEDSPTGVASAQGAGLWVIGVPSMAGVGLPADQVARSLDDPEVWAALGLDGRGP